MARTIAGLIIITIIFAYLGNSCGQILSTSLDLVPTTQPVVTPVANDNDLGANAFGINIEPLIDAWNWLMNVDVTHK